MPAAAPPVARAARFLGLSPAALMVLRRAASVNGGAAKFDPIFASDFCAWLHYSWPESPEKAATRGRVAKA